MLVGCFRSDPEHTAYEPQANGDKPEIFEFGFVQVCKDGSAATRGAARFAEEHGMYREDIARPKERVLAAYTFGEPMRAHLMVERIYKNRFRVGISTFRGYPTEIVDAAHKIDFCSSSYAPPNSFKPNPQRGAA
jgi:hypothetical protein